jgi:hypothetical protein
MLRRPLTRHPRKAPRKRPGPARGPWEGGDVTSWGKALVIWPDLEDPEGRARIVLVDPLEAYLWQGL